MCQKYKEMREKYNGSLVLIRNTYQEKMIQLHKWHLSEAIGHDVGIDYAMMDWVRHDYDYLEGKTHAENFSNQFNDNIENIVHECLKTCKTLKECKSLGHCPLQNYEVHNLLQDGYKPKGE